MVTDGMLRGSYAFFRSLHDEYDYFMPATCIDGEIPAELRGTLLRNGPGQFEIFGKQIGQRFDGDGMVCRQAEPQ